VENRELFDFMIRRVKEVGAANGLKPPQAFGRWFADTYFQKPRDIFIPDGAGDAKIDLFFNTVNGKNIEHCVLNTKFTEKYNSLAPVAFYNEINSFWQAFANSGNRQSYLSNVVRPELRPHYKKLFKHYDEGSANLFFVTNSRRNEVQMQAIKDCKVQVFHLEDVLQFMVDYIEDAMPHTPSLMLTGISTVLSAGEKDSEVPTSIVFARLADFIRYMDDDPYDLLFARNVRLSLGPTPVNREIRATFKDAPKEFAFSNNGITVLCEKLIHDPGAHEITVENPRIVNGSQTLHSIRDVPNPSSAARIMVRIIEIPPLGGNDLPTRIEKRKDIIHKISIRSNRQNDIKKWDLVSNDDFQHEIARYFRTKRLYYERRRKEWRFRRTELKSLGIKRGPEITRLTQLIASYYWDLKLLGPVAAKRELGLLFDGRQYEQIKTTPVEIAYQLHILAMVIDSCVRDLALQKQYVAHMAGQMKFTLFALIVKALQGAKADWGTAHFTKTLQQEIESPTKKWLRFAKLVIEQIHSEYKHDAKRFKRTQGQVLQYANYFKSSVSISRIFAKPLSRDIRTAARSVLS
jgi:hypothetical protein